MSDGVYATLALSSLKQDTKVVRLAQKLGKQKGAAAAWRSAAVAYERLGNEEQMVVAHQQARDLWVIEKKPAEAAYQMQRLWYFYHSQSLLLKAVISSTDSYQLARQSNDKRLQLAAFTNVLSSLSEIGEIQGAHAILEQASEFLDIHSPTVQFYLHFYRGQLYYEEGRFSLAHASYLQAVHLEEHVKKEDPYTLRAARFNIVDTCLQLGCLDVADKELKAIARGLGKTESSGHTALGYYRARLELSQGNPKRAGRRVKAFLKEELVADWRWEFELLDGKVLEKLGDEDEAILAYQRAATAVESLRESMEYNDFKASILVQKREPLERLFQLYARRGDAKKAFELSEQARARSFVDAFVNASKQSVESQDESANPQSAVNRHTSLVSILPALSRSPMAKLRPVDELLFTSTHAATLAYFETNGQVWVSVVHANQVKLHLLTVSVKQLGEQIDLFDTERDNLNYLATLGASLLPSAVLRDISNTTLVQVVADGVVGRVPFAALRVQDAFFVETRAISYIPSLSAMFALRALKREPATKPVILGVATPAGDLQVIPGANIEATFVAQYLHAEALLDSRANKAALQASSNSQLLHIAAHTGLSSKGAWLAMDDGLLYAAEIFAMGLRPRTVVLASCESAARQGEGMWGGLGASFLASGSGPVVASLWPLVDSYSILQVQDFYKADGASKPIEALAKVQRAAIKAGELPSSWAGTVVLGVSN